MGVTMRAVRALRPGGPEVLTVTEEPRPSPGPGEVLLRVEAAGVNRADVMQRQGQYDPPPGITTVLGLECAGTVVDVGRGVSAEFVGRTVCALLAGGGYAEYAVVPVGQTAQLPPGVGPVAAAGIPEAAATVWSNVVERGRLAAGERVLIHGGASGIGSMAIQVAAALGAEVVTTVGSQEKAEFCRELGATCAIIHQEQDFDAVLSHGPAAGVDLVVDIVGGPYLERNLGVLRREGRLVQIGLMKGAVASLDLGRVLARNLTITGSGLRTRPPAEKARLMAAMVSGLWPLFGSGRVQAHIHGVIPLEDVRSAHELMETGRHLGKIVLTVQDSPLPQSDRVIPQVKEARLA